MSEPPLWAVDVETLVMARLVETNSGACSYFVADWKNLTLAVREYLLA